LLIVSREYARVRTSRYVECGREREACGEALRRVERVVVVEIDEPCPAKGLYQADWIGAERLTRSRNLSCQRTSLDGDAEDARRQPFHRE
jgi:hypothetical protein